MNLRSLRTAAMSATVALALVSPALVPAGAAAAAPRSGSTVASDELGTVTSRVVGTFTDTSGGVGTFTGTFTPSRFAADGDQLTADGLLAGQLVDSQGAAQEVSQPQTFAVRQINPGGESTLAPAVACHILNLDLGPLDLNLLGLTVHLDEVLLIINALPGAGNLLGNLLCAVAGLLDGVGTAVQIAALLNQILALLGLLAG